MNPVFVLDDLTSDFTYLIYGLISLSSPVPQTTRFLSFEHKLIHWGIGRIHCACSFHCKSWGSGIAEGGGGGGHPPSGPEI